MPDVITVVIVDDHAVVRQGVRDFLQLQPTIGIVGEGATGAEAVALALELAPDVLLLDMVLPDQDGVAVAAQVKRDSPRTNIVILTSFDDDQHILSALRAGALSYLLKDISPEELVAAIERAARGEATLHPKVAAQVVALLQQPRLDDDFVGPTLSPREREVLSLVADGLSNAEIAAQLYISEKTVKSHVSNLLCKLQLADRTQAAVYAWRHGLKQDEPR
ncbi:response regulator transcription factor [bacterium]|nr:response regulator transcription factor [bacterium]